MIGWILPKKVKDYIRTEFRWLMQRNLPDLREELMMQTEGFFPHKPGSDSFMLQKTPTKGAYVEGSRFPVPDPVLRGVYGPTAEAYLEGGRRDVQAMRDIVERSGITMQSTGRILDFGCSSGRMIRWLDDLSSTCEVWGTDIRASRIIWCKEYLAPPFHFAISTLNPHLPFEDRYFGLIYAGSVFTHIDDIAYSWFLELRRILRPGGRLYVTIHDRKTVSIFKNGSGPDQKLLNLLRSTPSYQEYSESDFGMFTIGRSLYAQVFYDAEYLKKMLEPFYRVLSVTEEAYEYQTGVLLERV